MINNSTFYFYCGLIFQMKAVRQILTYLCARRRQFAAVGVHPGVFGNLCQTNEKKKTLESY